MQAWAVVAMVLWGAIAPGLALAGKAHEHGVGRMDVAVESRTLTVMLETPLENLVGFERAPRTAAEKERVEQALATLRQPANWLVPDAAAACTASAVEIEAPALGLPAGAKPIAGQGGHADLQARVSFQCADATRATHLEVGLFKAFKRFKRVHVQWVTAKAQSSVTLKASAPRLALVR